MRRQPAPLSNSDFRTAKRPGWWRLLATVVGVSIAVFTGRTAFAQSSGAEVAQPIQWGPLGLTPGIAIMSTHESNVFRTPDAPQSDVVTSVLPQLAAELRIRRLQFDATVSAPYTRFGRFRSQGQPGVTTRVRSTLTLNRVSVFAEGGFQKNKGRELADVDTRVVQRTETVALGGSLNLSPRTGLELATTRSTSRIESDPIDGVDISQSLGQERDRYTLALRRSLTPLTNLRVLVEARRDRFPGDNLRDSDELRAAMSLESTALLNGQGAVGVARFEPRSPLLPRFTGVIADAAFDYPISGRTLAGFTVTRDVAYSYQPLRPYYVTTSFSGTLTQGITPALALRVLAGRQQLAYRTVVGAGVPGLRDTTRSVSAGLVYQLGRRITFTSSFEVERRADSLRPAYSNRLTRAMVAYEF